MKKLLIGLLSFMTFTSYAGDFKPTHCGVNELESFVETAIQSVCIAKTGRFLSVELEHLNGDKVIYKLELNLITGKFIGQNAETLEQITGQLNVDMLKKRIVEVVIEKDGQFFKGILDPV